MKNDMLGLFEEQNGELARLLRQHRGLTVHYFANPGNAGDSLIAAATYQILQAYEINLQIFDSPAAAGRISGETVFLAGGGNLVPVYHGMGVVIKSLAGRGNRIIILPHSIRMVDEIMLALEPASIVFCRERATYNYVVGIAPHVISHLSHDMALFLDKDALRASDHIPDDIESRFWAILSAETALTEATLKRKKVSCMRHGLEKTFVPRVPNNDISIVFKMGVRPGSAEMAAWMMINFAELAAEVTTNRLHMGIASALAGTKTVLYDNSYGKVSQIYKHSMMNRFTHVSFLGEEGSDDAFRSK
jgi:exopolysaccharide biosynthesis predicted pyruvyltransferase EpsI